MKIRLDYLLRTASCIKLDSRFGIYTFLGDIFSHPRYPNSGTRWVSGYNNINLRNFEHHLFLEHNLQYE